MKKGRFLFAALCLIFAAFILASTSMEANAAVPTYKRSWEYFNCTLLLSPNWAWTIMPGHRYEFSNQTRTWENNDGVGNQFLELFTGPVYINKISDNVTFKLPIWYYYMGFPNIDQRNTSAPKWPKDTSRRDNDYYYSHNIEFVPIFEIRLGSFTIANRIILHNKLYANNAFYTRANQRRGWSMMLREMVTLSYNISPSFTLTIGDEVFFGMIEDRGTNNERDIDAGARVVGEPFFEGSGFSMNRFYLGFIYKYSDFINVHPQYMLESNHNTADDYELISKGHYLMVTVNYTIKLF